MGQKSELINLEYKVKFKDGLRPRVHVYGIDSKAGEIYGANAILSVSVGAGYHLSQLSKDDFKDILVRGKVNLISNLSTHSIIDEYRGDLPKNRNWEKKLYNLFKKGKISNLIRVQDSSHLKPAIDRHAELYAEQFRELAKIFANQFLDFMEKNPGLGKYSILD